MLKKTILTWIVEGVLKSLETGKMNLRTRVASYFAKREAIKMLDSIKNKMSGSKTYIVAGAAILGAFAAWLQGAIGTEDLIKSTVAAVLAMTTRAAIAKTEAKQ